MKLPPDLSAAAKRRVADEVTRRSLSRFHETGFRILHGGEQLVPGPHIEAMVFRLEQLAAGEIKRLLITLPPRHGKSELISGSFGAWVLGHDPAAKVSIVSYGLDLAEPLLSMSRTILKDPTYQRLFPEAKIKVGKDRGDFVGLTHGGSIRAVSKAGAITGLGTHFMIVDDFHKAGESLSQYELEKSTELFQNTFSQRFDNLGDGRMVIVMQRIHASDLAGWAIDTGKFTHLNLPATAVQDEQVPLPRGRVWHRPKDEVLAPAIASAEYLADMRLFMGRAYNPQFQQDVDSGDGSYIDWSWFGQFDDTPQRSYFHKVVQSWDPAASDRIHADYSVGMTWGFRDGYWYLVDLIRARLTFKPLLERVISWHKQWRADALIIEGASIGSSLYDYVKRERLPGLITAPTVTTSKEDRLAGCTGLLSTGAFLLPASVPWLPALRNELLSFPNGRNDDQVDALTQFIDFAFDRKAWVEQRYDENGRRIMGERPSRRSRYYDGDVPSAGSFRSRPRDDDSSNGRPWG